MRCSGKNLRSATPSTRCVRRGGWGFSSNESRQNAASAACAKRVQVKTSDATLCAIMKNEREYIFEWVAFHRAIGFKSIVVYSNDCSDGTDLLLDDLARKQYLIHRAWPSQSHNSPQLAAYSDALGRCETEWIAFLDADEFLNLKQDASLADFLARYDASVSAVAINWRIFGSSGESKRRDGYVTDRFVRAAPKGIHLNRHCKTIARTQDISEAHIHRCFLQRGRYVDTDGKDVEIERMGFTPTVKLDVAQVNHYVVKSREEFEEKRARGNANRKVGSADKYSSREGTYFQHHDRNEEDDSSVQKFRDIFIAELQAIKN